MLFCQSLLVMTVAGSCRPSADQDDAARSDATVPVEMAGESHPGAVMPADEPPMMGRDPTAATAATGRAVGADPPPPASLRDATPALEAAAVSAPLEDRPGLVRFAPTGGLWIDRGRGEVIVSAKVALTEGPIELFACPSKTKEYESLLVIDPLEARLDPPTIAAMADLLGADASAFEHRVGARLGPSELIHLTLVLIGLEPGRPVAFVPDYRAATGSAVRVRVRHRAADGTVETVDARDWIRDIRTGGSMDSGWVFAGSTISRDPTTGMDRYEADAGDLICVSNFQTALLDLPVPSAQSNEALVFEVMPGRVPAKGTPVEILLSAEMPAVTDAGQDSPPPPREP